MLGQVLFAELWSPAGSQQSRLYDEFDRRRVPHTPKDLTMFTS